MSGREAICDMDINPEDRDLIDRHLLERASADEVAALEARLLEDPGLKNAYLQAAMAEADLRGLALQGEDAEPAVGANTVTPKRSPYGPALTLAAVACLAIVAITTMFLAGSPRTVGNIVSSEDAGWQSSRSTTPGARIGSGEYFLQAGLATIAFDSGAEMVLEAPAKFEVVSEMQVVFDYGNAAFYCPDGAAGFQVETRFGRVVDQGTRFTLQLRQHQQSARLAVKEGEVELHLTGNEVRRLKTNETALMTAGSLSTASDPSGEGLVDDASRGVSDDESLVVLGTGGRETSIVFNDKRSRHLDPGFLMVKRHPSRMWPDWNRRALFAFDVSQIPLDQVVEARLILNSVPTGRGMATEMPKRTSFAVYGIPDDDRENWASTELKWSDAPKITKATQLATFQISRTQQRTVQVIETNDLLEFIKNDRSGVISFILDCEPPGGKLVHGFASSRNREAVGPKLELKLRRH